MSGATNRPLAEVLGAETDEVCAVRAVLQGHGDNWVQQTRPSDAGARSGATDLASIHPASSEAIRNG